MGRLIDDRKPVVLVVEDEHLVRMIALEMVEDAGFEAIEASDADEAIQILESRNDIRAVFTDVHMPGSPSISTCVLLNPAPRIQAAHSPSVNSEPPSV